MKLLLAGAVAASLMTVATLAQTAEDPIKARQDLMTGLRVNMATLGTMAQGKTPYDATVAAEAAATLVSLSQAMSMAQFPQGSEAGTAPGSKSLPAIWENEPDFLARIAEMNTAAAAMQAAAGTDLAALQGSMAALGGACGACHKVYRQSE